MNWRLCFQLDREHEGSGQFPRGCVELSQCSSSPLPVGLHLTSAAQGWGFPEVRADPNWQGCRVRGRGGEGVTDSLGVGYPVHTPYGHSKDQMARLILDSVKQGSRIEEA